MERSRIINILCGSHLYGLNTEKSDKDFKGIFLPTRREIILGRTPSNISSSTGGATSKNDADDVDTELFSLQQFIKLACEGQTCALEMLWAPLDMWTHLGHHNLWLDLVRERGRFLSKNMKAFVGFARAQAAKYSLKGDRLNSVQEFHDVCWSYANNHNQGYTTWMGPVWDQLPKDDVRTNPQGIEECQIAGKWFGKTTQLGVVIDALDRLLARYGKRAKAAAEADGNDWKALSHALRVSYQCQDLMFYGNMTLPFPEVNRQYLLKVKLGQISIEEVRDEIDESLAYVESLAQTSGLPEKVDREWWDDWLVNAIEEHVL